MRPMQACSPSTPSSLILIALTRARDPLGLVGAAAGGGTMVRSAAAPAAFLLGGLLVVDSEATMELG